MKPLPDPGFAGDQGAADPQVAAALDIYAVDGRENPVLAALGPSRLLVPVVAAADQVGVSPEGLPVDKSADVSAVLMRGQDGRLALLAFTSLAALNAWDPRARPVPVSTRDAARAAAAEDASALLVDVAGPTFFVVESDALARFAEGRRLESTSIGYVWSPPVDGG